MRVIWFAAAMVAAVGAALGNGGGYYYGGVSETGAVRGFSPSGVESIRILDEQLRVVLGASEAMVEVRYVLKNVGKPVTAQFGFPVEELEEASTFIVAEPGGDSKPAKPMYCKDYLIEVSGKPVKYQLVEEKGESKQRDDRRVGLKGWLVSKVAFSAGEEKTMRIRYRSEYPYSVVSFSGAGQASARKFVYRLSTGACWDGPIEKGRVEIQARDIDSEEVTIVKPLNRFKREGASWIWSFENLEPTLDDDIIVEATQGKSFQYEDETRRQFINRKGKWSVVHSNYAVKASSTLPSANGKDFSIENVKLGSSEIWCEGANGNGVGEWIEITPEVAQPLKSIGISSSKVTRSEKLWPKRVEILLNDVRRFEANFANDRNSETINVIGFDEPVKKIRITFLEVYPGRNSEDLAIAEISLESRLKKEPKLQPVR